MSNLSIIKTFILGVLGLCFTCCGTEAGKLYTVSATILLVNETSVIVKSYDTIQGYKIQPGDTLIRTESYTTEYGEMPSINNYIPFANAGGRSRMFLYGDNSQCENGMLEKENYENRKEVSPLVFEFTFRFTEERKAKAEKCNI